MQRVSACPPPDTFNRYLNDLMAADELGSFEPHLLNCPTCGDRLRAVLDSDPLLPLAGGSGSNWSVPVALRNRLLDLAGGRDTNATAAQYTPPVVAPRAAPELARFLRPPQQPDEIGRLPGYRVLRELGRGGMGVVCLAEDETLGRLVALKLIRPDLADPTVTAMFLREARALAATPHDHVVTVFQVGQDGDTLFLVMELLEGQTVSEYMKNAPARPLGEALRIVREAAAGLNHIHRKGVVHRDIKPANLWLSAGSGRVKLLDFGLARKPDGDTLTRPGAVLGTPAYMAPEQARGQTVGTKADLFSLGVVLYELCAGASPFARGSQVNSLVAVAEYAPPPLDRVHPWLPNELVNLTSDLLKKDAGARVQTAAEVVERLKRIEGGLGGLADRAVGAPAAEPIELGEPAEPAPKPRASRWKRVAALAAGLVFAAGVALALSGGSRSPIAGNEESTGTQPGGSTKEPVDREGPPENKQPAPPAGNKGPDIARDPALAFARTGEAISPLALTREPARHVPDGTWTLETTAPRNHMAAVAYQPNGKLLAVGSYDGTVRLYEADTAKFVKALVGPGQMTSHRDLAWSPDGRYLAARHHPAGTVIWDVERGAIVRKFGQLVGPRFSPDGTRLAGVLNAEWNVLVYDLTRIAPPVVAARQGTAAISVAWHPKPGTNQLMVGYQNGEVRFWDVGQARPEVLSDFDTEYGASFDTVVEWPEERVQWVGGRIGSLVRTDGKRANGPLAGSPVSILELSPDRTRVVAAVLNGRSVLAEWAAAGRPSHPLPAAYAAGWSPDGKELALSARGGEEVQFVTANAKAQTLRTIKKMDPDIRRNAERGFFDPQHEALFVFVVQYKDGTQKTLTPPEFEKLTGGRWKNDLNGPN